MLFKRVKYYVKRKVSLFRELYLAEQIEEFEKWKQYVVFFMRLKDLSLKEKLEIIAQYDRRKYDK